MVTYQEMCQQQRSVIKAQRQAILSLLRARREDLGEGVEEEEEEDDEDDEEEEDTVGELAPSGRAAVQVSPLQDASTKTKQTRVAVVLVSRQLKQFSAGKVRSPVAPESADADDDDGAELFPSPSQTPKCYLGSCCEALSLLLVTACCCDFGGEHSFCVTFITALSLGFGAFQGTIGSKGRNCWMVVTIGCQLV
eukprot:4737190-Amphidinium_carterae.2